MSQLVGLRSGKDPASRFVFLGPILSTRFRVQSCLFVSLHNFNLHVRLNVNVALLHHVSGTCLSTTSHELVRLMWVSLMKRRLGREPEGKARFRFSDNDGFKYRFGTWFWSGGSFDRFRGWFCLISVNSKSPERTVFVTVI